jgi:protein arginine kinase activator
MFDITSPCSFCGETASYYVLDVLSGSKKEWYLCAACRKQYDKSGYLVKYAVALNENALAAQVAQIVATPTETTCSNCGMTLSKFMRTKRVGCANDYELFKLGPVLKEYHKSDQHMGKVPADQTLTPEAIDNRLKQLRSTMAEAIESEKYEDAARFRDEIRTLKKDTK